MQASRKLAVVCFCTGGSLLFALSTQPTSTATEKVGPDNDIGKTAVSRGATNKQMSFLERTQPIRSLCWGQVNLLGTTVVSDELVKGAVVMAKHQANKWDWSVHQQQYGDLMAYHAAGVQPNEVQPFIEAGKSTIFITAGVLGVLQTAESTSTLLRQHGYEFIDLASQNSQAAQIGQNKFRSECRAQNLAINNLSQKAQNKLSGLVQKMKDGRKLAIRAYTGDALILFNKLHEEVPDAEMVGLLHSNC